MLNPFKRRSFHHYGIVLPLCFALVSGCSNKDKSVATEPESKTKPDVKAGSDSVAGSDTVAGAAPSTALAKPLPAIPLPWQKDLSAALSQAAKEQKYLFIDFTAQWCKPCQELESTTFRDPEVAAMLKKDFVLVKLDVSEQTAADKALMADFGVANLPALLATQQKAVYLQINRLIGPKDLQSHLAKLPAIPSNEATP